MPDFFIRSRRTALTWRLMTLSYVITALFMAGICTARDARAQEVLDQKISLRATAKPLRKILETIEKQTGVRFLYSRQVIQADRIATIDVTNEKLQTVLSQLFRPLNISYRVTDSQVVLSQSKPDQSSPAPASPDRGGLLNQAGTDVPANAPVQVRTVNGTVRDAKGETLPGVNVLLRGTQRGVTTSVDGRYQIEVTDNASTLIFSYVGYLSQTVTVGSRSTVNITLLDDAKALSEVVVVGYGTRKREDVSGAVTQVDADLITHQPITSIDQGLAGLTPGVTLRQGSGAPGAGPEILIRGINTFGNNKPLIVIDNVIFENGNDQNNNPLALINPEDIETVTILKDAATKAIYGSRATAGVIIVTTKRGKEGKPKITFNGSVGQSTILPFERPDVLNATELAQFYREVNIDRIRASNPLYASPETPVPDDLIPAQYRNPAQYGVGTNWFDAITQKATVQNYNLSVSGGTPVVKYFVSGNYLDQQGVVINNGLKRFSLRANVDVNVTSKLRFGLNLNPSRTDQSRPADDPSNGGFSAYGAITSSYWADPSSPIYSSPGFLKSTTQGSITTNWTANPLYRVTQTDDNRRANQLLMGSYLEYEPIKNLTLKTNLSYGYTQTRSRTFAPSQLVDNSLTPISPNINGARAGLGNKTVNNLISDNTARYLFERGIHNLEVLAGFSVQNQTEENSSINTQRIIDENFRLPDFSNTDRSGTGNFTGGENFLESRLLSYIGRVNYTLAGRYLFNASIRRDGSSRFGREVQYGNFPAGSVAWRISEEPFMAGLHNTWLDELRLEAGYGLTGNNGIGAYGPLGSVGNANYIFGGAPQLGNTLSALPNPTITWEKSKQFDIGLNASLLNRRVNVAFNVYQQITEGLLAGIPLSWITGFGNVTGNQDSRIRNRGFELQLDLIPVRNKTVTWTTGLNVSRYNNLILDYYDPRGFFSGPAGNGTNIAVSRPGGPVGVYRGLKTQGLFTAADIADASVPKYPGAVVGSLKYLDGNGNGRLDIEADYVDLGSPHPDLMFGWNNQVSYKGFSLRAIFAGQLGGLIYDLRREIMWNVDGNFNVDRQMLDRFRPGDDPTQKSFPTTVSLTGSTTRYVRFPSDNKIYDGTYAALKNLTLSYNIASVLPASQRYVSGAELVLSAANVFYIAAYKYGNPEVRKSNDGGAVRSVNYGSYPIARTVTLGLNLTF